MQLFSRTGIVKRFYACTALLVVLFLAAMAGFGDKTWGFVGLCLVFAADCGFFYWGIYHPIKRIEHNLESFNTGYDSKSLFNMQDNFTPLLSQTLDKIGQQLGNQQVIKLSNRQAQYLALQNQINPHFLYNTLEAIRGDALSEGLDKIATTTEALATFFRYTISNVDSLVTIEEELNNAENYFAIQNYRFGDKINMRIEADEEIENLYNYQIPKLTLQPIIENAIIHGIENKIGKGTVGIKLRCDSGRIILRVEDDGVGMPEAVLSEINHSLKHPDTVNAKEKRSRAGGIALVNVNNRIRLLFGEQYGLRVSSVEGLGTQVEVTLPVRQ